jgi:hypothetical protein
MAAPVYTRILAPEKPAAATPVAVAVAKPHRPTARIRGTAAANKKIAKPHAAAPVETDADINSAQADPDPDPITPAPELPASAAPAAEPGPPEPAASAASEPADPAYLATWPGDTRLSYTLGGNYRGELHGNARVLWQRVGTRYQTVVALSAGFLASLTFSSQGEITAAGLRPEVYEEDLRGRRRGVRLDADSVLLHNGERVPRPDAAQDTASQFAEIGHRLATGQLTAAPGTQLRFALARPGGVDDWTYDVVGEETIHLPRLGDVSAWHVKPRPLDKPRGPFMVEMWLAPTLQYLPVRIRITQDADTYIDLLVQTIEQK